MSDYQQRIKQLLNGQRAPLIDGERTFLARCNLCARIWLSQGQHRELHVEPHALQVWAKRLHANLQNLPAMTCRSCLARYLGGEFSVDEYAEDDGTVFGYGFSWEALAPPQHLLLTIQTAQASERNPFVSYNIVTQPHLLRSVLAWFVSMSKQPFVGQPFPREGLAWLAESNPPGAHAPGTSDWIWRGCIWTMPCPPLRDTVVCGLAQAMSPTTPFALGHALAQWQTLIPRMLQGHFFGDEEEEQSEPS